MSEALVTDADAAPARVLSRGKNRFLRYWSLNMTLARRTGQGEFPGFSYSEDEWARMDALSDGISTGGICLGWARWCSATWPQRWSWWSW